jgi:hypothetical protein
LNGRLKIASAAAHGWFPVGPFFKVTRARGLWLRALDGLAPGEVYAKTFGSQAREWGFPPLNELVRLYPLGLQAAPRESEVRPAEMVIRSPVRMENDGNLRMNTIIPEGSTVHLLTGSSQKCIVAARDAARRALTQLLAGSERIRPVLALLFVDAAWQELLLARPGEELQAVRAVIGEEVPIAGGYTFGQIGRSTPTGPLELLNQHIQVVLIGTEL